jgi:hypothetical protein
MMEVLFLLASKIRSTLRNRTVLALENLALRQQLAILNHTIDARGFYPSGGGGGGSVVERVFGTVVVSRPFAGAFAQIAAGGTYETVLTGINAGQTDADVLVSRIQSGGAPFDTTASPVWQPAQLSIQPMGAARLQIALPGNTEAGYAVLYGDRQVDGTALFKTLKDDIIISEAGGWPV